MGPLMNGVPIRNDKYLKDSKHGFFLVANFCHLVTKKGLPNPVKGFLKIFEIFLKTFAIFQKINK
jgi:hypothetical protein